MCQFRFMTKSIKTCLVKLKRGKIPGILLALVKANYKLPLTVYGKHAHKVLFVCNLRIFTLWVHNQRGVLQLTNKNTLFTCQIKIHEFICFIFYQYYFIHIPDKFDQLKYIVIRSIKVNKVNNASNNDNIKLIVFNHTGDFQVFVLLL